MDQLVQCPVCTLYLHNGMTLESHLDTHPKDQVIKALCSLATSKGNYTSRTSSPLHSERSYRSRSRTPAADDKWNGSHRTGEHERYWRRTPSRTPKSTPSTNISRNGTPDIKMADSLTFESSSTSGQNSHSPYALKADKVQTFQINPMSDFEQTGRYYQDPQDDREIKYSRSAEYNQVDNNNGVYAYNMPPSGSGLRYPTHSSLISNIPGRKGSGFVKIVQKPNNIFVKTDAGGMQYLSGAKPMHVMMPGTQTFVQKNMQNNMIIPGSIPPSQIQIDTKGVPQQLAGNQFNQLTTGSYTPGLSTVVTQNSQIIYREMLHNIDGKPYISSVPAVIPTGSEHLQNAPQAASMYQNLMVVDQFGSCMYTNPQQVLSKPSTPTIYTESGSMVPTMHMSKTTPVAAINDAKTLIIEVGPIVSPVQVASCSVLEDTTMTAPDTTVKPDKFDEADMEKMIPKCDTPVSTKGLKILSNIKVEVPVQHNKNMVNTIMDLTGSNEPDYPKHVRPETPENILSDLDEKKENITDVNTQPSTSSTDSVVTHAFSVIKNVGNPSTQKESTSKSLDSKLDTEYSDSCPVPDLICNENPSISPCSELSESGENSIDRTSISPKVEADNSQLCENLGTVGRKIQLPTKPNRLNLLRLNNIYVKKNKKVLKIKNAKQEPDKSLSDSEQESIPSSSSRKSPENFAINKTHPMEASEVRKCSTLKTVSMQEIKQNNKNDETNEKNNFDADTEEQAMDIEPIPQTHLRANEFTTQVDMVQIKEEISTSNEGGFSNETITSERILTPLETLRPISVVSYGNVPPGEFDDESNHRELLDLEAASKNKQFVSMINENYFGDNIYADYFTPDRVEAFSNERDSAVQKEGMYGIWGEPSQKENEFVLPNFIHESYKIAESNETDYTEMDQERLHQEGDGDGYERDSKAEVLSESRSDGEAPLNICADERMPPRGELSGQESNGDMESPWNGIYPEVTPSEPYDLMARESWVSDGSDVDANEKREIDEELHLPKSRTHTCAQCSGKFQSAKELRSHKSVAHAHSLPTCSVTKTTYSRMVTARAIKKEEEVKTDDNMLSCSMMAIDSKESITTTILQAYDMEETKAKIEGFIKQETKRRRKDFVCPTCKVDQVTDAAFHAHLKIHPLECLTCGKCFFRRANLALHIKTHLGIKNYKCEVCEKRFVTRQKLAEHHNVHTGRAPVKCTLCEDTFRRYSNMVQHRDRHHFQKRMKVRDFVCQCGAVFHSRAKLLWHKETHDDKPKSCPYCSDKFVHAASLTRHMRRTHNEYYLSERLKGKVDNVPCPICKQVYLRTNLRSHLQTHSGKRPYVCIICNKAFTTKWNLKLHRWTHMSRSAKPFKCHLCKGAFIRHTEYISHMNAHKSVRPYTCNYCGCQFIRKYNCQRHVREHEMAKKYVCKVPECGKSFHRSYYLSEHMKVHSGARPFACNICGKTSSNKSNHNKHVKIHHAREPVATEA